MEKKVPSAILSFIKCKCPQCRQGNLFQYPSYQILKFYKGNTHCPNCKLQFEHETGFFWGAMYFSYALNAGMMLFFAIFSVIKNFSFSTILIGILMIALVITIPFFRISRSLLMYLISPYRFFKKEYLR